MKAMLQNSVFIGFTGTPLLKADKQTSLEVFGKYIHTYKFKEAVNDKVILDLIYEARDIDQKISSPAKIDEWFEAKTRGLNDFQKSEIKHKWGTMQKVLSSRNRIEKIVNDIILDFNTKPRLSSTYGNAILISSSIYEACKYFDLFQRTELKDKCAIVTSYNPSTKDIVTEDTGADTDTDREFMYKLYKNILGNKSTEKYEDDAHEHDNHERRVRPGPLLQEKTFLLLLVEAPREHEEAYRKQEQQDYLAHGLVDYGDELCTGHHEKGEHERHHGVQVLLSVFLALDALHTEDLGLLHDGKDDGEGEEEWQDDVVDT